MNSNTKKRLNIFLVSVITVLIIGKFIYESLSKNTVYFFSPSDLFNSTELPRGLIRVGGMVKKGSLIKNGNKYSFTILILKIIFQ